MYPRLAIDISWRDLIRTAGYCLRLPSNEELAPIATEEAVVTLSVRSAFDLLLSALELPAGSQVLLSEVTVPHVERIVREHRLAPVAVPVDPLTLSVDPAEVEERLTDDTRVLVVAHLFGTRMPLKPLAEVCRDRNILLVEDCAQALTSGSLNRDPSAEASLYSFGPIKTATALGGGIALVGDDAIRARMKNIASTWPGQSAVRYATRVVKIAGLKLLSQPALFSLLVRILECFRINADEFVGHSARGFPDEHLLKALRHRPCRALQRLIARRLRTFDESTIVERQRRGRLLAVGLPEEMQVAGCDNPTHTYWVFPLICPSPQPVVARLRRAGFDASQISGLTVLGDDQPDHWFGRTVFVPHGIQIPEMELERLQEVLCGETPNSRY